LLRANSGVRRACDSDSGQSEARDQYGGSGRRVDDGADVFDHVASLLGWVGGVHTHRIAPSSWRILGAFLVKKGMNPASTGRAALGGNGGDGAPVGPGGTGGIGTDRDRTSDLPRVRRFSR
jgi:hypothetical protein